MRLAGLDRGPQRATTAPSRCVWPTNSSSVRGRIRAASGRSAAAGCAGRAGGSSGTSKSRPIALSMRPVPARPLRTVAREWGRIGVLGFGGPPAHVALLRDLTVERRAGSTRASSRTRSRPAASCPARRARRCRSTAPSASRGRWGALVGGLAFILPGLLARAGDRRGRARRRAAGVRSTGFGAGAAAAVVAVVVQAGLKLIDPRRGLVVRGRRRARRRASPAPTWSRSCCCAGWRSSARHSCMSAVWPALIWLAVKVGALSYGGGYVIIPLMYGDAVEAQRWMTEQEFANAVAYGQITPGPVTHTVALVGYAAAGLGARARRHRGRLRAQLRVGHARRAATSSACGRAPERARLPRRRRPGRRGRDPRRRRPAARRDRRHLAVGRARGRRGVALLARVPPIAVLVGGGAGRGRHYALAMGLAEELQDETAEVLSQADPLQAPSTRPATSASARSGSRTTWRTPGWRSSSTAPSRSARTSSPRCAAATGRRSATSRTSTPCWPTPRTGAPTRGAPRSATASSTAAARST